MHNMEIVRTYADHGKSGLDLIARPGLQQLLKEALEPGVDFRAVLVYDVSRFGRFQNPDEAASHEYRLNQARIPVHYCAEVFENDGSLASTILKTVKRGMAGEYSRELSAKVWAGNCRIATLGFHIGGVAGYGTDTAPRGVLARQKVIPALDAMNTRYGLNTVYMGSIHDALKDAPTRIPFSPPPPLEEFDDTADNVRRPPTRYMLTADQLARRRRKAG
jgi:hypothetical protein